MNDIPPDVIQICVRAPSRGEKYGANDDKPFVRRILWHCAATAERRMVPRLPGSLMLSQISVRGSTVDCEWSV